MLLKFLKDIIQLKGIIFELARRDYQQQHQGSYLGFVWNYLQPLLYIAILYAVFTLGFRHSTDNFGMPFGLYLLSGMICWLYFANNLTGITGAIRGYSFLVKKVDFRLSILPFVKLLSALPPHLLLIAFMLSIAWLSGYPPGAHNLQLLYYYCCMIALLSGLGWITASTSLFVRDIRNVVSIAVQFGLWLTPIFWNTQSLPERYQWIANLNPVSYLVTGYRESLTGEHYFWQHPYESLIFWGITLLTLCIGTIVYRRLKPHFAEVL